MAILKYFIENYTLSPAGMIMGLFALALLLKLFRWKPRLSQGLMLAGVFFYFVILFTPLTGLLLAKIERPFPPMLTLPTGVEFDTIVVLSGSGSEDRALPITNTVSDETACRIVEGIRLYRQRPGLRLLFTGGKNDLVRAPISKLMAGFATSMGVPERDIITEQSSHSTFENLVEAQKVLGAKPFVLVTSAYHLRRAMAVSHKLGMHPIPAPAWIQSSSDIYRMSILKAYWIGDLGETGVPDSRRLMTLGHLSHEYMGYLWYWIVGKI